MVIERFISCKLWASQRLHRDDNSHMPKRNTSINLTESALQMADAMAQEYGVSRAAIIELAVRVLFKNRDEFLKLSAKDDRSNNQP